MAESFLVFPTYDVLTTVFVVLNIVVGFLHGYKAERAMESLRKLSSPKATVLRRQRPLSSKLEREVPSSEVVVGDIVILRAGQVVPADIRLFRTFDLQINESLLTGESLPALKTSEVMPHEDIRSIQLGSFINIAYSGTLVVKGEGYGIVYATGMSTEMGKLAEALGKSPKRMGCQKSDKPHPSRGKRIKVLVKRFLGLNNTSPLQKRHI